MTRPCPICPGEAAGARIGSIACTAACDFSQKTFELAYCGCGGLVYLDPAPSERDLRILYEEETQFADEVYTAPERVEAILEYMTSSLQRMRAQVGGDQPLRVLEVGAGLSWMCRAAKALDASNRTVAQDVSPEARKSCPWVDNYVIGTVHDRSIAGAGPFDVISLTHVIEHLLDPVDVISRCVSLLSANGVVFVTAPHRPVGWHPGSTDIEPWRSYSLMHVPAHIQYFSRESMGRLAARCGAEVAFWDDRPEKGEAFEAWLTRPAPSARARPSPLSSLWAAVRRRLR